MTRWIGQLEIEAECLLPDGAGPFQYVEPNGLYSVRLVNRAVRPLAETPLLEMQLEFESPDLRSADQEVGRLARHFLYWLSFATQSAFRVRAVERVIDWTPGLNEREQFHYFVDRADMPFRGVVADLAATIALFSEHAPPAVNRAVRWFSNAMVADLMDDQFQCFFFAIEILAEHHKASERVADLCPKCRKELFCKSCNGVPTHKPYPKQAIRQMLQRFIPLGADETFHLFNGVRNDLMHGKQIDEIEADLPIKFEAVVDRIGEAAWRCVIHSLRAKPGKYRPTLLHASTFVRRNLVLKTHLRMGAKGGDPNLPRLEDQGTLNVSVTLHDG